MTSPLTDIQAFISVIDRTFGVKGMRRESFGRAGEGCGGAGTGVGRTKPIKGEVVWNDGGAGGSSSGSVAGVGGGAAAASASSCLRAWRERW